MIELRRLIGRNRAGSAEAMASVCSAHPTVLAAALRLAEERDQPLLIEATSNQVNQDGGYTGMTPAAFIGWVNGLADRHGVDRARLRFGGDHLGPQAWRRLPADPAMARARTLVHDFVAAGFTKIHLDCSEGCAGEPAQVGDAVSAARSAELAGVCEAAASDPEALSYIFGTEVPPPGGARADDAHGTVPPTAPGAALATIAAHEAAFAHRGLEAAFRRAVGLVVQPGLEFAPDHVMHFDLSCPDDLSPVLASRPGLAFEAHSTDYQSPAVFRDLARRHFAVLKVGPALTFALRRALYALDGLAQWTGRATDRTPLAQVMEHLMRADPAPWQAHYQGPEPRLRWLLHFGYADRIRYYWTDAAAQSAVAALMAEVSCPRPPLPMLVQFFGASVVDRAGALGDLPWAEALLVAEVQETLLPYMECQTALTR